MGGGGGVGGRREWGGGEERGCLCRLTAKIRLFHGGGYIARNCINIIIICRCNCRDCVGGD